MIEEITKVILKVNLFDDGVFKSERHFDGTAPSVGLWVCLFLVWQV